MGVVVAVVAVVVSSVSMSLRTMSFQKQRTNNKEQSEFICLVKWNVIE